MKRLSASWASKTFGVASVVSTNTPTHAPRKAGSRRNASNASCGVWAETKATVKSKSQSVARQRMPFASFPFPVAKMMQDDAERRAAQQN
jgi:hypothetical protein